MPKKIVTLALQGGGSHGAFTWGVLDRLLKDERIDIEGISAASAGAMNAVVFAHGYTAGGREGARQALKDFWESVAKRAPLNFMPEDFSLPVTIESQASPNPALKTYLFLVRFFSPYQLNPFDHNPLRDILSSQLDFERLRADCRIKLFIAATQVSTGTLRLFRTKQLTLDVLLASACVPTFHHPIEIEGEAYWDGALTANPPIFPLLHQCAARDVMMVLVHPCRRPVIPTTVDEIRHRLAEISFSSAFFTELQGLALAKREAERGLFSLGRLERRLKRLNMHVIDSQELMSQLSALSNLNVHSSFIHALRDEGSSRAETWLEKNFQFIGVRSSFSLDRLLH